MENVAEEAEAENVVAEIVEEETAEAEIAVEEVILVVILAIKENLIMFPQLILNVLNLMIKINLFKKKMFSRFI